MPYNDLLEMAETQQSLTEFLDPPKSPEGRDEAKETMKALNNIPYVPYIRALSYRIYNKLLHF